MSVLSFLRQEEPRFESVPDDKLIDFIVREEPEFLKDPTFRRQARTVFGQQANADESQEQLRTELADSYNPLLATALGRSATRGAANLGRNLIGAADAAQSVMARLGLQENPIQQLGRTAARSFLSGGSAIPSESPEDLRTALEHGPASVGAFAIERGIGEQLPQMVGTALTAGAGMAAGLTPKAASIFGILANSFPLETGGAFEEIRQTTGQEAPFTAAGVGAVNAFLETIGDSALIQRMLGGDQLVGRSVSEILKRLALRTTIQSGKEAGTEAAQELVTALAPVIQGAEVPRDLANRVGGAALLGGVGGGAFGGWVDIGGVASQVVPALLPESQGELTRAQRSFLQPGVNELQYSEGLPIYPGEIGFNEQAAQALPGEAPPLPFTRLPSRSEIPSSINPSELIDAGFGVDRLERPRPAFDQPLIDPGIQLNPTLASEAAAVRVAAQQEALTREQRVAQELLARIEVDRQQSIAEAQQLEQSGRTDLANLRFATSLAQRTDQLLALGQRMTQPVPMLAPAPETDLGLQQAPAPTIAPSPVDALLMQSSAQPPTEPAGVVAPAPIQGGPNASGVRVDQTVPAAAGIEVAGGQVPGGENLSVAPSGQSTPAAPQETLRQQGQTLTLNITPSREQALREIDALPPEELDRAAVQNSNGIPTGTPETNAGRLLQEFLYAPNYIRQQAAVRGIQLDAEAEANMERRYQELAMDAYTKAQGNQMLMQQTFSRTQAFQGALRDTNRMNNTAGNLRDRVGSTELVTESGTITRPEVERAANEQQATEEDIRGAVLDFLDLFNGKAQKEAVVNLLADAMGYPRPAVKPSPRRTQFENDAQLRQQVEDFVRTTQPTRNSIASLIGSPMSVADVTGVVNSLLTDSSLVRVIDDPTLQDEDGNPLRGQYRPGEAQPYILNAAFLGSAEDVRRALYEEQIHGVWLDPEVAGAWEGVKSSLTTEDMAAVSQYPPEVQQEEAAIRKVINEIESGNQTPAVVRWIQAVIDAIKRLFGVDTTTDARRIFARALKSRSGTSTRNSLAEGLWSNAVEAQEEAATSGDPMAVLGSAAAQGSVIPQKYIDALTVEPTTREQRTTQRLLRPVTDAATMGRDLVSSFAPVSPDALMTVSGMPLAPSNAQDIAAEAIVKQHLRLQSKRKEIQAQQAETSDALEQAFAKIPEALIAENSAELYRGMSDQLADDYRDYLKDQMLTLKRGAFDPEIERQINDASRRVTEDYRGIGNAVANGLRAIAKEIPVEVLVSPEATRSWIEARLNDPAAERLMSDTARDWLLTPVGTGKSPIQRDDRINQRLAAVKGLAEGNDQAIERLRAFQAGFKGKKVSPEQFARRWQALREKYADSLATMKEINREVANLDADYNGQERAIQILDQILADPEHQAPVDQAVNRLQASSTIRQYEVGKNGEYTGKIVYQNPSTGKTVKIDLRPDFGVEQQNVNAIRDLIADVQAWGAETDDRVARAAWEKEVEWLQRYAMGIAPGLVTGSHIGGYRLPSFFQMQPFGRELSLGRIDVRAPAYQRIGNRMVQGARQAAIVYGQVDREMRQITEQHDLPVKSALVKAAKSHGREGTREDVIEWYVPTILEPLVSQNQNPTSRPYQIGDFIDGNRITKEDFEAARALKARDTELFAAVQKAEKDSGSSLLYYNPLQTAEEFQGKPLSRRSTDYGWKMPRRPESRSNERGRIFTTNWIEAQDGVARRALLDQNFGWVLMGNGLLTNTDKEFSPKVTEQDQALFREIQDMQRTNSLPFTDLDGLVAWAGEQLATDEMPEAQAAAEFELRLLGYVDTFVRNFNRALEIIPQETQKLFERLNVPRGTIDSVGVGDSPFVSPRGRLVAPPSFYRYTTADDQSWGSIMAGVRTILNLREIEAISAAQAAINRELERFESKTDGEIIQMQRRLKSTGGSRILWNSPRRRVARNSKLRAEAGELMYDYLTLKNHQRTIDVLLSDMERLGREHVITPEDSANVSAVREGRQLLTSSLLQSIVSVFSNVFGGTVSNTLYRRGLGSWNFASTPVEMLKGNAEYIAGNLISKARKIQGIDSAMKTMLDTPGFRKIAELMVGQQLRFERDRAIAMASRTVDETDSAARAGAAKLFPESYGRLIEDEPGPLVHLLNNLVSRLPGAARTIEASKTTFPGAFDRMINQVTTSLTSGWTEEISQATDRAWAARDTGEPGWDDLTQPFNHFTAKDLDLPGETQLSFWRNMLAPAGSLESLSLDQYKRKQAGGDPRLLSDGQLQAVAQEIARSTNMSDAAHTPTLFQGRGVSGELRKSLFMLLRYPINFAAVQENLAGKAYGDNSTAARQWRAMSGAVAIVLLLLLTSIGGESGQEIRQLVTGDPRTRTSIATILEDPNLKDLAKYAGISISSVFPFFGEQVANLAGGTANRPALDASRMFAPLGVAMDLQQAAQRIWQTGDMTYPIADLTRRYVPLSGAVINRAIPGEIESRAASRAVRLAAPSDMELRQSGGIGGRQTPQTPLIRDAVNAALSGDQQGAKAALERAVQLRVANGQTEKEARQSVDQAFKARDPEKLVLGREATPDERQRLLSRMSSSQRRAYLNSRSVFKRPTRTKIRRLSSRRRRSRERRLSV